MKYTANTLAALLNVSNTTIRRYTDMGYITPFVNKKNNYKYYTTSDINTIIRIRMYRKFGFTHEDIKKLLISDKDDILSICEHKLAIMTEELENLRSLTRMFKANTIMIRRIEEFSKNFIAQDIEATYYIPYQKNGKVFKEKERLASIHQFMYTLPETKDIFIFDKADIDNNDFSYSLGFAAKKKDTDKYNIEINNYMTFQPVQNCIYFLLKTYSEASPLKKNNSYIIKESFSAALAYLKQNNYRLSANALGFNITTSVEDGIPMVYTLVGMPVENI